MPADPVVSAADTIRVALPAVFSYGGTGNVLGATAHKSLDTLLAERERDRQRIEQHYDELLDAERRALDYQEFIAWTLDEFGARMPEAWKTRARAALAVEEEAEDLPPHSHGNRGCRRCKIESDRAAGEGDT